MNEAYSRSLQEGIDEYEIEHRILQRNTGKIRHVHERCVHERDDTGTIIRSTGMVQDITERVEREEEIRIQNATITVLHNSIPDRQMLKQLSIRLNEEWITNPDGKKVPLSTLKAPYWDQDGVLLGVLGIGRDITDRKDAEEKLQAYARELVERMDGRIHVHSIPGKGTTVTLRLNLEEVKDGTEVH